MELRLITHYQTQSNAKILLTFHFSDTLLGIVSQDSDIYDRILDASTKKLHIVGLTHASCRSRFPLFVHVIAH